MTKKSALTCFGITLLLSGCDQLIHKAKEQPNAGPSSTSTKQASSSPTEEKRFVFPAKSSPFPESSVALDTMSGRLCKTYQWQDSNQAPRGLPVCSELSALPQTSFEGARKAYRGSTYSFNGTKWVKGAKASKYNVKTNDLDPESDDQYDPLNLFSKEEKAKRTLTEEQIRSVADRFGVTYAEAWEDAKAQGYRVPPQH
jgi:hypothetical protein